MNQLNITFNPIEDRLLLRMTSQTEGGLSEYRLWLTRRYVKLLGNVLYQMLEAETAKDARIAPNMRQSLIEFQQEATLSQTDFSTPYSAEGASTPLGKDPLLVSRIQVFNEPDGRQVLSLQTEQGKGIHINVNGPMIHSFRKLLADGINIAQWDISLFLQPEAGLTLAKPSYTIN